MPVPILPQFKHSHFILNKEGVVLEASGEGLAQLGLSSLGNKKTRLREALVGLCPAWDGLLPENWSTPLNGLFLPWGSDSGEFGSIGLRITSLLYGDICSVSLSPALAKNKELKKSGLDAFEPTEQFVRHLALRLQSTEHRLSNYLENYPGVFFSQRPDLSFSYISKGFESIVGLPPESFYRNSGQFLNLIHEEDIDYVLKELDSRKRDCEPFTLAYRLRHPVKNTVLYLLDFRTPLHSPGGLFLGYDGVWLDNTRQAIAENSLRSTTWKATLGTVTGGLLHDFSNIISGIYTLSELYCSSIDRGAPMYEGLEQIRKNSQEGQRLIRRIIDLNREEKNQRTYHNIERLIEEQLDLIRVIMPKRTEVLSEFTGEELPVHIDDVGLRQVLLNLAMNARDALTHNGRIVISVERVLAGEPILDQNSERQAPSAGARIRFSDNGVGIAKSQVAKIFAPYYSTKEASRGSGFGLYNAVLFAKSHNGFIGVRSEEGRGAQFEVFLPLASFEEESPEDEVDSHIFQTRSPRCVVYACRDASGFELVNALRCDGWELICVSSFEQLKTHMQEAPIQPDLFLGIDIAGDPQMDPLMAYMVLEHSGVERVLQIYGSNPDALSTALKEKVQAVYDDQLTSQAIVKKLLDRVVLKNGI